MNSNNPRSRRPFNKHSKQWASNGPTRARDFQKGQRSYERSLALAKAQARASDIVAAEIYYQHAEIISGRCRRPRTGTADS